jgi:hypothetical protein
MPSGSNYVIYSLADLAEDGNLGKFCAESLIRCFQSEAPGPWAVDYYPPKQLLIVHGNDGVQARAGAFLKDLRQAAATPTPTARPTARVDNQVKQASATNPDLLRPVDPTPPATYPVPRPTNQPKHLFHFIIRYEGDGIVDSSVVDMVKALQQGEEPVNPDADPVPARARWADRSFPVSPVADTRLADSAAPAYPSARGPMPQAR